MSVTLTDGSTIPQLGYGTWQVPDADATAGVATAIELGYRHIDTAAAYENEVGVGKGVAASGLPRDEVFITTKLWNRDHGDPAGALGRSLEKLGTDHVDLYLIHWPLLDGSHVAAWEGLVALQQEGLARAIGVSNYLPGHLDDIVAATGVTPAVNQVEVHPTFANSAVVEANARLGVVTESWSPLGRAADLALAPVQAIAEARGATPAQVVLAWHLAKGYVVIPKSVTPSRIAENLGALQVTLTAAEVAAIDALDSGNRQGPDPATFNHKG